MALHAVPLPYEGDEYLMGICICRRRAVTLEQASVLTKTTRMIQNSPLWASTSMKGLSAKLGEHSIGGKREATQVNGAQYVVERDRVFAVVQMTVTYGSYFRFT
jgi:hypothetical protein